MIKLTLGSWKLEALAKEYPDDYLKLREHYPQMGSLEDALAKKTYTTIDIFTNDLNELPDSIIRSAEFDAVRPLRFAPKGVKDVETAIQASQIHLPGNELLKIRQTKVLTDLCTDTLNDELQNGWRIIAVCIQPDQRRPDYVLGRYDDNVF